MGGLGGWVTPNLVHTLIIELPRLTTSQHKTRPVSLLPKCVQECHSGREERREGRERRKGEGRVVLKDIGGGREN